MHYIFFIAVVLVAYLSLFPWEFGPPRWSGNPLWVVLTSWPPTTVRRFIADVAANVAIYIPIGVFGYLSLRMVASRRNAALLVLACGAALSAGIETAQVFTPRRVPSAIDLLSNIGGTAVGITGAVLSAAWLRAHRIRVGIELSARSAGVLLLLTCFVGYQIYPGVPQASLPLLAHKLRALTSLESLSVPELATAVADWGAVAVLLNHAVGGLASQVFCGLLLLAPARFVIHGRAVTWTDLIALPLALLARSALALSGRHQAGIAATALALGILARGLGPMTATSANFTWVPFGTIFSFPGAAAILLLKAFRYGGLIWLLRAAGWPLAVATVCVTAALGGLEMAQLRMPNHSAEITDPFLALATGLVLFALERYEHRARAAQA